MPRERALLTDSELMPPPPRPRGVQPRPPDEVRAHMRAEQCVTYTHQKFDCGHAERTNRQTIFCKEFLSNDHNCEDLTAPWPRNVYGDCGMCQDDGPGGIQKRIRELEEHAVGQRRLQAEYNVVREATGVPLYIRESLMKVIRDTFATSSFKPGVAEAGLKQLRIVLVYEHDGTKSADRYYIRTVMDRRSPPNSYHQLATDGYENVPEDQWEYYWQVALSRPNSYWESYPTWSG
jgi:hypothetical protein